MPQPKVLLITGNGINTHDEAKHLYTLAGAQPTIMHVNDLIASPRRLADFQILEFPGGFVDGDYVSSAIMHANRLRSKLGEQILEFVREGKLFRGVCNGFQLVVKMGLLPGFDGVYDRQVVTLTDNSSGKFEDRWVYLEVPESGCLWTKPIQGSVIRLPVRHGEGKFRVPPEVLARLRRDRQIALRYAKPDGKPTMGYPFNPNGSEGAIAAITNDTGTGLGLMPHPEGAWSPLNLPDWRGLRRDAGLPEESPGLAITRHAVEYAAEALV